MRGAAPQLPRWYVIGARIIDVGLILVGVGAAVVAALAAARVLEQ